MKSCLIILYLVGLILLLLSIYLNEVVKQDFGVKKSPFFIFKKLLKIKENPSYINVLEESNVEDDDSIQV